jgi:hypothetical protein
MSSSERAARSLAIIFMNRATSVTLTADFTSHTIITGWLSFESPPTCLARSVTAPARSATTPVGGWWRHPTHRVHHRSGADPDTPRRTARTSTRLAGPGPADRLARARAGPRRSGNLSGVARRAARDRRPQPLTAFHATVRTAREKSGFKAVLRQREKSGLERG